MTAYLERFSAECRKTKTKVSTLANHNSRRQFNEPIWPITTDIGYLINQSQLEVKKMYPEPSTGKRVSGSQNGLGFTSD